MEGKAKNQLSVNIHLACCILRCNGALSPVELKRYLEKTESISASGNPSKDEGLAAQLEELSKASKVWEHGALTAKEWQTIMRNHDDLSEVNIIFWKEQSNIYISKTPLVFVVNSSET